MLYGLNGYALRLEVAAAEAMTSRQQWADKGQGSVPQSPAQFIREVYRNGDAPPSPNEKDSSFENIFRAVAEPT